jgi:U3 small nucleolar RNA-associated protein 5
MSTQRKLPAKLGQPTLKQSAKSLSKGTVDESRTVVSAGGNAARSNMNGFTDVVDISSDSSSAEEDEDGEGSGGESESVAEVGEAQPIDGKADVTMEDTEAPMPDETEEAGEPSFGDLVRANASEPIDVAGAFEDPSSRALTYPQKTQIQPPSGSSLGTVLTQALRTNDISLLESCLHTTDVSTIRATIQRLDSPLAGTLLQKLAERLHRKPGRAGSLMVWVQWTLVTHGGYLSLKGKLDMLEAQIELRRGMQLQRRRLDEEDDDEGVIYVEGQESDEEGLSKPQRITLNGDLGDLSDDESEISGDMPITNGVVADSDDEDQSSDDDNLIDDEAEETDEDGVDEDEVDHDDQDSQEGEEESDDGAQVPPPTKIQRISGAFSRKG